MKDYIKISQMKQNSSTQSKWIVRKVLKDSGYSSNNLKFSNTNV